VSNLEEVVQKNIILYNKLKRPEIMVKLIFISPVMLTVSFTGSFCYGCGIYDYVEGFANQFKILTDKYKLKVIKTREINTRTFEIDYNIKIES
jgi:hypothetical protein